MASPSLSALPSLSVSPVTSISFSDAFGARVLSFDNPETGPRRGGGGGGIVLLPVYFSGAGWYSSWLKPGIMLGPELARRCCELDTNDCLLVDGAAEGKSESGKAETCERCRSCAGSGYSCGSRDNFVGVDGRGRKLGLP